MPRLISLLTKEQQKESTAAKRLWSKEQRDLRAKVLRGLRNGTFRPWEQFSNYNPEECLITRARNDKA